MRNTRRSCLLALVFPLAGIVAGRAQTTVTWTDAGTDFATGANWSGGAPADSLTANIASFGTASPASQPALAASQSVAGVVFANGAGAFTLSGAGTLTLGAAGLNNLSTTGTQTVSAPLALGAAATISNSGNLTLTGTINNGGFALTLAGTGSGTIPGAISGAGALNVTSGTWALTAGANSYSGGTVVSGGTLSVTNSLTTIALDLGPGGLTLTLDSGTLQTTTALTFLLVQNPITLSGSGGTIEVVNGTTRVQSISGTAGLTKTGAGTLALTTSAMTYTGSTTINTGTLMLMTGMFGTGSLPANNAVILADTVGARLNLNDISQTVGSLAGGGTNGGNVSLGVSAGTVLTLGSANSSTVYNGAIDGAGSVVKMGTGTQTLGGTNTYTGGTTINSGTLAVGSNSALGTGAVSLNGGTLAGSAAAPSLTNAVTLDSDSTLGGSQPFTLAGTFTLSHNRDLTVTNTATTTISGVIGESGGSRVLAKYGSGELDLTGANTYTGGTLIAAGTVRINNLSGSAFGTGAVTVASGGTLRGAGSFSGALQNNGLYSPGNSPTLQTVSSFAQGSTGTLEMELGGLTRGAQYDALAITGAFQPGGTLSVLLINGYTPTVGANFDLFDYGSIAGTFLTVSLPGLDPGLVWDSSALYSTGTLSVVASAIPEPSVGAISLAAAALGAAFLRRRRRKLR